MAFDWREFLTVAEALVTPGASEAALRTAIGRAYYASYGSIAQRLLAEAAFAPHERVSHRGVWRKLQASQDSRRADMGDRGDLLKRMRIDADYQTEFPGDPGKSAREAILEARTILRMLDELP